MQLNLLTSCQMQAEKKFQELVIMMPNSALVGCTLPLMTAMGSSPTHLMAERASPGFCCSDNRESSWQPACLSEERKSKHPSSSPSPREACSATIMCSVLFVCFLVFICALSPNLCNNCSSSDLFCKSL